MLVRYRGGIIRPFLFVEIEMSEPVDITTVIPETIVVTVKGQDVEVRQIKVGQLTKVMRIAYPFYDKLRALKDAAQKNGGTSLDLYQLVFEHGDSVLEIVALLTGKDKAWVEDMDVDELVALFSAIVEVNLDFFIQRVLPSLSKLVEGLNAPVKISVPGGQTPSSL